MVSYPKLEEIAAKSIIVESALPGVDFVINPYTGCRHGCIYCYADFMKKYSRHDERWGDFVDVKINAPFLVDAHGQYKGKLIMLSSVTDPYQPIEAKYQLTRKILERLVDEQPIMEILTKSALVTRDIDIFKQFKDISIGVSMSTINEEYSRQLEPFASSPLARLEALKKCKEAGLRTFVFLSPIFPHLTEIEEIIEKASPFADYFMFENLNIRLNNRANVYNFIRKNRPELASIYREIYESGNNSYWDDLEKVILEICKKHNKEARIYFHHGGFKK